MNYLTSPSCFRRVLATVLVVASLACDREPKRELPAAPPAPVAGAAVTADASTEESAQPLEDAATEAAESVAPAPEAPKITPFGVPECDSYVKKYLACVEGRVPAEQRAGLIAAFEANRTKWRALAAMREGAIALALACRTATLKSKEALSVDYGCEF